MLGIVSQRGEIPVQTSDNAHKVQERTTPKPAIYTLQTGRGGGERCVFIIVMKMDAPKGRLKKFLTHHVFPNLLYISSYILV